MKYAILIDGAFATKKLQSHLGRFPRAEDIGQLVRAIQLCSEITSRRDLLRVYFYDAPAAMETIRNPLDGRTLALATTRVARQNRKLRSELELMPSFALRMGEIDVSGWELKPRVLREAPHGSLSIGPQDIKPRIAQKGVDLRIGLDVARLSLRGNVDVIVVVSGDSDLIPAFKFARREGLQVVLATLGHGVTRDMRVHTDLVISPENHDQFPAPGRVSDLEQ